ncbi:MAG: 30S ribosome-binding factor RbfA [Clostridia bacterium]|nr:30S ribosome-binding factor RbfA [Clostridia bacterium]
MSNYRRDRINDSMAKELTEILRSVKDPRVSSAFVSVTGVDCTPDLKYAKVFYSSIGGKDDEKGVQKGLDSAAGYVRKQLAIRLDLRNTPELRFVRDRSMEHGAHIMGILKKVENELREIDEKEKNDD